MRDFNSFEGEKGGNTQNDGAMNVLSEFAKRYEGASETELIAAIMKEAERRKKAGTLSDEEIDNFAAVISPMLNSKQRKQLGSVVEKIKRTK